MVFEPNFEMSHGRKETRQTSFITQKVVPIMRTETHRSGNLQNTSSSAETFRACSRNQLNLLIKYNYFIFIIPLLSFPIHLINEHIRSRCNNRLVLTYL